MRTRCILHVDMDAFYASIEQRDDPTLRGKPLVVGGGDRGVVAAASYEARRFGIRSAMPMAQARNRCPVLVRVAPRMEHYQAVSREIFAVLRSFTPVLEGLSLDEAFLDMTGSLALFGDGVSAAREIKARIHAATGLTASVGVAENKLVAKIASDLEKPDGLVAIPARTCRRRLDPLPVAVIPGIGPRTLERLKRIGIEDVRSLRLASDGELAPVFGRFAARMRDRAAGIDDRPVIAARAGKSISAERTFAEDLSDPAAMDRELLAMADGVARKLQDKSLVAGTVQVKIRTDDFATCTRQKALRPPANGSDAICTHARELLHEWLQQNAGARVRLLGAGTSALGPAVQADLFDDGGRHGRAPLDGTVKDIRDRFGEGAVSRARALPPADARRR